MGLINLDAGSLISGIGSLAKDLRAAFTGKDPIDATKAAELALKAQELESKIQTTQLSIAIAESQSSDKYTSRARPSFLYCFYTILISMVVVFPVIGVFFPEQMKTFYANVALGFNAIPEALWYTFTIGYLGYVGARQVGKIRGSDR